MYRALTIALLLAGLARPVAAQPSMEISGGSSLAHDPRDGVTLPAGWIAVAAAGITPKITAVVDVSGQYKTIPLFTSDAHLSAHTVMGGIRTSARIARVTAFAQLLAGAVRTSGSAFGATSTATTLAVQPGVGVDCPLARVWAARAQFDVRLLRSQADATNGGYQTRLALSLVYHRAR